MSRLRLLLAAVLVSACGGGTSAEPKAREERNLEQQPTEKPDLEERTIEELQALMQSGRLTSEQLVQWYLERIRKLDRSGPTLRSVIAVSPDALSQAAERDQQRVAGDIKGVLHGIPLLIKDNIETRELPTTAGSLALKNNRTERDAAVVAALRKAGAVILGKTNLSEFANFRGDRSVSGWSALGGQTRNPYNREYSPCGSSSGSAVAVSANLVAAAVGTETDGSIVCPSAFCGVVGLKPSRGQLSGAGVIPISSLLDTAGPMARTVADVALLFSVMRGDSFASTRAVEQALKDTVLAGKRIGVMYLEGTATLSDHFEQRLARMRDAGAELVVVEPFVDNTHGEQEFGLLIDHFKSDFDAYFASLPNRPFSDSALSSIVAFNRANAEQELVHFGQELFELALVRSTETRSASKARKFVVDLQKRFAALFKEHKLQAVVMVTSPKPMLIDWQNGDDFPDSPPASAYAAVTGFPHVTVPMGLKDGLPLGLSFMGLPDHDLETLGLAHAFERMERGRVAPELD